MTSSNNIDNSNSDGQNTNQMEYETINIKEHEPLYDPGCKHTNIVRDPSEELGDAFQCTDCKRGVIFSKVDSPS